MASWNKCIVIGALAFLSACTSKPVASEVAESSGDQNAMEFPASEGWANDWSPRRPSSERLTLADLTEPVPDELIGAWETECFHQAVAGFSYKKQIVFYADGSRVDSNSRFKGDTCETLVQKHVYKYDKTIRFARTNVMPDGVTLYQNGTTEPLPTFMIYGNNQGGPGPGMGSCPAKFGMQKCVLFARPWVSSEKTLAAGCRHHVPEVEASCKSLGAHQTVDYMKMEPRSYYYDGKFLHQGMTTTNGICPFNARPLYTAHNKQFCYPKLARIQDVPSFDSF